MGKRRGLSEALDLTPEKIAFIRQERVPEPIGQPQLAAAVPAESIREGESRGSEAVLAPEMLTTPRPMVTERPVAKPIGPHNLALVPLTTRLQPATSAALRRAYLERKLAGAVNATQQEIVEEALQSWLRSSGFLD